MKKLLICPYFGSFPEWMDLFLANYSRTLKKCGYDLLIETDLLAFQHRVYKKLEINCPITRGSSKGWDYRCALGFLFNEELEGYEWWGHVDFDVVFGNVQKFVPDRMLHDLDVYSSHDEYVCGCFSLYRNTIEVNRLFSNVSDWRELMTAPEPNGWVEHSFSRALEQSGLRYKYDFPQGNPWAKPAILKQEGISLFQKIDDDWTEIMFHHFRHSKTWPL